MSPRPLLLTFKGAAGPTARHYLWPSTIKWNTASPSANDRLRSDGHANAMGASISDLRARLLRYCGVARRSELSGCTVTVSRRRPLDHDPDLLCGAQPGAGRCWLSAARTGEKAQSRFEEPRPDSPIGQFPADLLQEPAPQFGVVVPAIHDCDLHEGLAKENAEFIWRRARASGRWRPARQPLGSLAGGPGADLGA